MEFFQGSGDISLYDVAGRLYVNGQERVPADYELDD